MLDTINWEKAWRERDTACIMKCFDGYGFVKVRNVPYFVENDTDEDMDDTRLAEHALIFRVWLLFDRGGEFGYSYT